MKIEQLTKFQHQSLLDCIHCPCGAYLLLRPNAGDTPENIELWCRNNRETDALVQMGLLDNVSEESVAELELHYRLSGRIFRKFRITAQGKAMFNDNGSSALSN